VALAEFPASTTPRDGPAEVAIEPRHALSREWAVVISADTVQACLAGWEQPSPEPLPDRVRRFEVLWSFDPAVVAEAIEIAVELVAPLAPAVARRMAAAREAAPAGPEQALHSGGALAQRMTGYLGALLSAPES
jgi:DICT domain-containing protein